MELDELLGRDFHEPIPAVRFFTWNRYTISFGRNQNPEKLLIPGLCNRDGIDAVRRPTGGRELLHGSDLCYSVIWPLGGRNAALAATEILKTVNEVLVCSLRRFGIPAELTQGLGKRGVRRGPCLLQTDRGEIVVEGRKLAASAQRVFERSVLQQGSILLRKPSVRLTDYLRAGGVALEEELRSRSSCFSEWTSETISADSIVAVFKQEFERAFGGIPGELTGELEKVNEDFRKFKRRGIETSA